MAFISEFTSNLEYIKGSANLTADALSRTEINSAVYFQHGMDYKQMADSQQRDKDICELLQHPNSSSLRLNQYALPNQPSILLWCDDSLSVVRRVAVLKSR